MNKKISVSLAITIAIIAMTVTFSVTMILSRQLFDRTIPSVKEKETMYSKLSEIDKYVRAEYYGDIQDATLNDMIAYGYVLGTGDKSAAYYTAKQYTELQDVQSGKLMGIGVDLAKDASGYGRITKVYADSPASELGLQVGGYITTIDGIETKTLTKDNMLSRLRGEDGTETVIGYMGLDATVAEHTIIRAKYVVPTVEYSMMEETYGYIRIYQFDSTTPNQLTRALNELQAQGATALVFDLRDNAGGLLSAAVSCLDPLVGRGDIVYAQQKDGTQVAMGASDSDRISLPMMVLVNKNTASSAELFAQTLREYNSATLVGVNTQGKGTIQAEPYRMSDGSAVVITVGKMITGKGKLDFDGVGLTVDEEIAAKADDTGETTAETDVQLQRAIGLAKVATGTINQVEDPASNSGSASLPEGGADPTSEPTE